WAGLTVGRGRRRFERGELESGELGGAGELVAEIGEGAEGRVVDRGDREVLDEGLEELARLERRQGGGDRFELAADGGGRDRLEAGERGDAAARHGGDAIGERFAAPAALGVGEIDGE